MSGLKIITSVFIFWFTICPSFAQKWQFGISGGLAFSKMSADSLHSGIMTGTTAGLSAQYNISEKLSIRTEPAYILRATRLEKTKSGNEVLRYEYILVPVLFQYEIFPGVRLAAGPELNILADISVYSYQGNTYDAFWDEAHNNSVCFYGIAGADFDLGKRIILHTRYEKSLQGVSTQTAIVGLRFIIDKSLFPKRKRNGVGIPRYAPDTNPEESEKEEKKEEDRWKIKIHGF